ncbi:recombinase family protein [Jiella marina]|uniref:recombinase family protein n=1 Tax=Jiella sp. LLJ827 TaxID=2917712 RepID=UPI002100EE0F|nr:recombinase family protein [Jiella sp. LLJ827]MCQ0990069.1 recombinase family protein [Jiella sp. LLJ827]
MASEAAIPASRYVTYLRVSTTKQGGSGLGIEAQREAVERYLRTCGTDVRPLAEYVEIESGKKADRPKLRQAIEHAQLAGARLVIAKLDRLSRNVHFLSGLKDAGVDFVAADMPDANKLTVHILAAVAEHEREMISERTKAALQAAKARGKVLGNPKGAEHLKGRGNAEAVQAIVKGADLKAERMRSTVERLQASGTTTAQGIAAALNAQGILSPRGGLWSATTVQRLRGRLGMA